MDRLLASVQRSHQENNHDSRLACPTWPIDQKDTTRLIPRGNEDLLLLQLGSTCDEVFYLLLRQAQEEEEVEVDEKEEFGLNGEDKTGRNRAFTDFHNVEKNILTTFDDLDNPEDIAMFEEYLIKNLSLYFDKFENELSVDVEAPAIADDAEAGGPGTASSAPEDIEPEDDIANIELEEVLKHLNIDDIIKNLL